MRTCRIVIAAACSVLLGSSSATAQPAWTHKSLLSPRDCRSVAYDPVRQRAVLFGGVDAGWRDDTWEWDGRAWQEHRPAMHPAARSDHAIAFDGVSGHTILFGGWNGVVLGDTWTWDGVSWRQLAPGTSPPPRRGHSMVWDPLRRRIVLFGGRNGAAIDDTWEWDGSTWTQVMTAHHPPAAADQGSAWDGVSGRVLRFGGDAGYDDQTWVYDGIDWTRLTPPASPYSRANAAMAWDPIGRRVLLFGGEEFTHLQQYCDTWAWNGVTWTPLTPWWTERPGQRGRAAMFFDTVRSEVLLFGGVDEYDGWIHTDTWRWDDGVASWQVVVPAQSPRRSAGGAMVYDAARAESVLIEGSESGMFGLNPDATWIWDGRAWTRHWPVRGSAPGIRIGHAMAYDSARQRVVLFGGEDSESMLPGTWEWDGTRWLQRTPPIEPPVRSSHAMAYDVARARTVLFGGALELTMGLASDTWTWDGSAWTQRTPAASPSARVAHAMAYDAWRGRIVLFGGYDHQLLGDTWEWDGSSWTERAPSGGIAPAPRRGHTMVYDSLRRRIVLFGGVGAAGVLADLWEWDGMTWKALPIVGPALSGQVMSYDRARQRFVVVGTSPAGSGAAETWELGRLVPQQLGVLGSGCGPSEPPRLAAHGTPVLGNTAFALDLAGAPAGAPCGLGVSLASQATSIGGCTLYLATPITVLPVRAGAFGFVSLRVPIPAALELAGATAYAQAFTIDPSAPVGLAFTDALRLTLGE